MSPVTDRVLGILGILGGGVLLLGFLPPAIPWTPDLFNIRLVLYGVGAMAIVSGVHARQRGTAPTLTWSAAIAAFAAHAVYTVLVFVAVLRPGEIGPGDYGPWFMAAGIAMWLSDAWFGLVTARLAVVDRWGGLALAIGSPLAIIGMSEFGLAVGPFGWLVTPLALTGVALNGLGWLLLGVALVRQAKAYRASSPAHGFPSP